MNVVPLADICEKYFGVKYERARQRRGRPGRKLGQRRSMRPNAAFRGQQREDSER